MAIALVLLRHGERALHATDGGAELGCVQTIFMNGWVGVDLFFVLSGYLIARHLLRAGIDSGDFRIGRYLTMRALRIIPAYYAALALAVAGLFPLFKVNPEMLPLRIGYHIFFLQDYLPSDINVVFWSLGVEEKFYLLAPLLIVGLLRCKSGWIRAGLLFFCFALPIAFRTVTFLQISQEIDYTQFWRTFRSPFHVSLEGFIIGVTIVIAQHGGLLRQSPRMGLSLFLFGTTTLVVWLASEDFMSVISFWDAVPQPALIAILAGAITVGAVQLAGTAMPLTRPFRGLSKLSYCLYLVHYPLIPLVLAITADQGPIIFWTLFFAFSMTAALLLHLAIERPFLKLKDRVASRTMPTAVPV